MRTLNVLAWLSALAGLAFALWTVLSSNLEIQPFADALAGARELSVAARGKDRVLLEGTLEAPRDRTVPADLAMGFEQVLPGPKRSRWVTSAVYAPRFEVRLRSGDVATVEWLSLDGVPAQYFPGSPRERALGTDVRAVGLAAGDRIVCLASVRTTEPLVVSATEWGCLAGSLAELRALPSLQWHRSLVAAAIVAAVFFVFSAAIALAARRLRKRNEPR